MRRVVLAAATALGIVSCTDSSGPNGEPVSLSVTVAPAPNAVNVSRGDTIRMWFDMPVDSASCSTRFALHMGDSTGAMVPGRMMFGDGNRQMMFVPDSLMLPGTRYFAHMRDSVMMRESVHGDGMGGSMMGGGQRMMMNGDMPRGALRMSDGMGWTFTTGNQ